MPRYIQRHQLTPGERWGVNAGWAGLALVLLAGIFYYAQPIFNWTVKGTLIAGILMLAAWISLAGPVIATALKRPWWRELNGLAFVLVVIAIFAVLNFISNRRHYQWDLTKNAKFTLASMSREVARKIDKPVTITAFYSNRNVMEKRRVEDLLKQYRTENDKLQIKFVDPFVNPRAAQEERIKTIPAIVFKTEDGKRQEISLGQEKEITGALLQVSTKEKKKIYFLQGHGEFEPEGAQPESGMSEIRAQLVEQQHEVERFNLLGKDSKVPADAAAVVIAGPRIGLQPTEVKALQAYLNDGGHLLVLLGPKSPNLKALLDPWGISVGSGTVVDFITVGGSLATPGIIAYESHDITRDLGTMATALPAARPITIAQTPPSGVVVVPLMKTSERSWAETNAAKIQYDGKDTKGPITVAAVATKDLGTPPPTPPGGTPPKNQKEGKIARVAVFGSADFATNYWAQADTIANRYLVLNTINWLAEETALVSIPPRDDQPERVTLTDSQLRTLQLVNFIIIPTLALIAGTVVWWKRR
jgi:ABC-type uncharacterized transport system involved in gliding motility auxiliary subunit